MSKFSLLNKVSLITEKEWFEFIDSIENDYSDILIKDMTKAKLLVKDSLIKSVSKRFEPKFGVLFSGGLDSSLIALISKDLGKDFKCYCIGLEGSSDIEFAKKVSSSLSLQTKYKILTIDDVEKYLKKCISILNTNDVVKLEISIVIYAGLEFASKDKINNVFVGAGSEEIFAGYDRHIKFLKEGSYKKVHEECWNGLKSCYSRDILRDYAISKYLNVTLLLPFLDKDLIKIVMSIHPMLKIDSNNKKIILRDLAYDIGLSKDVAYRKRTAAQYGSKVSNALLKLAHKNGFKYKQEYINSLIHH